MPATPHSRAVAFIAFVLVAGCRDTATQVTPTLPGTYVMQTAAGQPSPALIERVVNEADGTIIDIYVLGDTLQLLDGGHYIQRGSLEARIGGQLLSRSRWGDNGVVTVTGAALHFESDYLEGIAFDGTVGTNGAISVTQNLANEGAPDLFVFSRVP